jgi:DNA invertase Pin-like site-specific DNA recombinase
VPKHVPTKIVGYLRTSTDDQLLGIDAQESTLKRIAADKHCDIAKVFTEHESGGNLERIELDNAIRHARRLKAYLVVAKLDRLARDQQFLMRLVDGDVPIIFGDLADVDFTTPEGRIHIQMLSSFAEFERNRIGTRTKEALKILKARGVKLGTPANLTAAARVKGATVSGKRRTAKAIADQSDIASVALELRAAGRSLRDIARHLNGEGYPTRDGKEYNPETQEGGWQATQVKRVLDRAGRPTAGTG